MTRTTALAFVLLILSSAAVELPAQEVSLVGTITEAKGFSDPLDPSDAPARLERVCPGCTVGSMAKVLFGIGRLGPPGDKVSRFCNGVPDSLCERFYGEEQITLSAGTRVQPVRGFRAVVHPVYRHEDSRSVIRIRKIPNQYPIEASFGSFSEKTLWTRKVLTDPSGRIRPAVTAEFYDISMPIRLRPGLDVWFQLPCSKSQHYCAAGFVRVRLDSVVTGPMTLNQ